MKKKEALYKIKTILDNLQGICSNKLQSEAILNELERSGMLPPSTQKLKKYEEVMDGKWDILEAVETVNEWDAE